MEFEPFFLTAIVANGFVLLCLVASAMKVGIAGQWGRMVGCTLGILGQVWILSFLGSPAGEHGLSSIYIYPKHFGVFLWMLAGAVALTAVSLRRKTDRELILTVEWLCTWTGATQLLLSLGSMALTGYGMFLLLQEPIAYGY